MQGLAAAFRTHVPAVLHSDAYGIYLLDPTLGAAANFVGQAPSGFIDEYERFRAIDPIYETVVRDRTVIDGTSLLGARAWRGHPLQRWMRHWGWQHSLQGPVLVCGKVAGTVNFARGESQGAFTPKSRRIAQILCEELSCAISRHVESQQLTDQVASFKACFDEAPVPLMMLDARGSFVATNRHAKRLLEHSGATGECMAAAARRAVAKIQASGAGAAVEQTTTGTVIAAMRLPGVDGLMLVSSDEVGLADDCLDMLSERSREVARLLVAGQQYNAIAWQLGVSENTIRYHAKRIYSEVGVSGRAELQRTVQQRSRVLARN